MMPVLEMSSRLLASAECLEAARTVQAAAEALAEESSESADASRYLLVADRISAALDLPHPTRQRLLGCSPAVIERTGHTRTLIEMIETDPGDSVSRLRLTKLLFRALIWLPETFPDSPA